MFYIYKKNIYYVKALIFLHNCDIDKVDFPRLSKLLKGTKIIRSQKIPRFPSVPFNVNSE